MTTRGDGGPYRRTERPAGMATVAVTRVARALEQDGPALASLLELSPYDLKLRLRGALPLVVAEAVSLDAAERLVAVLRELGHGAVGCPLSDVVGSEEMFSPRAFHFRERIFVGEHPSFGRREVLLEDVLALVRATHDRRTRAVSPGAPLGPSLASGTRAYRAAEGYLRDRRGQTDERIQVLYVFSRASMAPIILRENELRYEGLGDRASWTMGENFATLVALLRQKARGAAFDERLLSQRRKSGFSPARGATATRVVASSNTKATDLAAHLIALAELHGQL